MSKLPGNQRWKLRRRRVLERDDYTCQACGSHDDLTIDHIRPLAFGGTDAMGNLQTLCRACHLRKSREDQKQAVNRQIMQICVHGPSGEPVEWCVICRQALGARTPSERQRILAPGPGASYCRCPVCRPADVAWSRGK